VGVNVLGRTLPKSGDRPEEEMGPPRDEGRTKVAYGWRRRGGTIRAPGGDFLSMPDETVAEISHQKGRCGRE
jgi:hypothetical protein